MAIADVFQELFGVDRSTASATALSTTMRLIGATVAGGCVAAVHRLARRGRAGGAFTTTLVLLTVLVALTAVIIGSSVARAFGLVGALSIVRFRTVVDDTRDTAFVIYAVVAGMALGSGEWVVGAVGVPLVGLVALWLARRFDGARSVPQRRLVVRVAPGRDPETLVAPLFAEFLRTRTLATAGSAKQGAALEVRWDVELRDPDALLSLVQRLLAIEGVQHAEFAEGDA